MRLLVVDDSAVMRHILIRALRHAGHGTHHIIEADNGRAALTAVAEHRPDLILSGWNMPVMSGIDALHALRRRGDHTPFAFVTAESSPAMRHRALNAGALFVLAKPFTADSLGRHLDDAVSAGLTPTGPDQIAPEPTGATVLPPRKAVRDLLERLLGKTCPVADGTPVTAHTGSVDVTVAEVITDDGHIAAVILASREFAIKAGACLSLVPPSGAADAISSGEVPEQVRAAFAEVLNVLSALFNSPDSPHVRLGRIWVGSQTVPPTVAAIGREVGAREDLRISIAGYGPGMLSLVLA